ncbi:hypothetical protein SGPA1_60169 [Streptomyces misionensis JCM 4497]
MHGHRRTPLQRAARARPDRPVGGSSGGAQGRSGRGRPGRGPARRGRGLLPCRGTAPERWHHGAREGGADRRGETVLHRGRRRGPARGPRRADLPGRRRRRGRGDRGGRDGPRGHQRPRGRRRGHHRRERRTDPHDLAGRPAGGHRRLTPPPDDLRTTSGPCRAQGPDRVVGRPFPAVGRSAERRPQGRPEDGPGNS